MAHSLSSAAATTTIPCSTRFNHATPLSRLRCNASYNQPPHIPRRSAALFLTVGLLGLNIADQSADAAARRPPPPPPQERKDPSVSGLQAKVLASKKRKDAMKEAMAKLREKGMPVEQQPTD